MTEATELTCVNPKITYAGRNLAFNLTSPGMSLRLKALALGTGRYEPIGNEASLHNETVRVPLAGAQNLGSGIMGLGAVLDSGPNFELAEVGVIADNGTDGSEEVLFAVWSSLDTPLAHYVPGNKILIRYLLGLSLLGNTPITVVGDANLSLFNISEFAEMAMASLSMLRQIWNLHLRLKDTETQQAALVERVRRVDMIENALADTRERLIALETTP